MGQVKEATSMMVQEKNITDSVMNQVRTLQAQGSLQLPDNYSAGNALKSAWLKLQTVKNKAGQKALEHCTKSSIANSLLDMVLQGLSPAKKQCDFIMYGNELQLSRSYFGSVAVAKRVTEMENVIANVILEDDAFETHIEPETGRRILDAHEQPFENLNNEIVGAYAIKQFPGGITDMEIMTLEDIKKAWNQGAAKGQSPAHKNFPGEMCKKTVINRACKIEINTSSDNDVVIGAVNRTTEAEYEIIPPPTLQAPKQKQASKIDSKQSNEPDEEPAEPENSANTPKSANDTSKSNRRPSFYG